MGRRSTARARLIEQANRLFRDRGYEGVGVAHLCQAAGVNKGSFYHFFGSKRELLLVVLDAAWDETGLLVTWETTPPTQPLAQLRQYLQELFALHWADREAAGRVRGSLVSSLAMELGTRDREVAARVDRLLRREIGAFANLLSAARDHREVALPDPRGAAEAVVACLHGLLMLAKVRDDLDVLPNNEVSLLRVAGIYN